MPSKEELRARVANDLSYHQPTNPMVGMQHDEIRAILRQTASNLIDLTPVSREQSLMLTAIEEAMHWANSAVAKYQYSGETPDG